MGCAGLDAEIASGHEHSQTALHGAAGIRVRALALRVYAGARKLESLYDLRARRTFLAAPELPITSSAQLNAALTVGNPMVLTMQSSAW